MPPIRTILLLHHSHTDIGYTNHQEIVLANQRAYMRRTLNIRVGCISLSAGAACWAVRPGDGDADRC